MKRKTAYICDECGYQTSGHLGKCPECDSWGSIKEVVVEDKKSLKSKKNN
jgi:DNA repair protein RadA/Sms